MRHLYIYSLIFSVLALMALPALSGQAQFFGSMQDVPLMPGLSEIPEEAVLFDKPGGRIAESVAYIEEGSPQAVESYYNAALPQFGWQKVNANHYVRQNESLRLEFEAIDGHDYLRLIVEPL